MEPCKDILKIVFDMYFPKDMSVDGHIGVILGPLGSGKFISGVLFTVQKQSSRTDE